MTSEQLSRATVLQNEMVSMSSMLDFLNRGAAGALVFIRLHDSAGNARDVPEAIRQIILTGIQASGQAMLAQMKEEFKEL